MVGVEYANIGRSIQGGENSDEDEERQNLASYT